MVYSIENEVYKVCIDTKGAELQSVINKKNNRERIWQANSENYWIRRAPILFPYCGALKNGKFSHNEKEYAYGQHGFLRNQEFAVLEQSSDKIVFEFKSSVETFEVYPFNFVLEIKFYIENNTLHHSFWVKNTSDEKMYFNVGFHPGFNCPFDDEHSIEDYVFEFEQVESPDYLEKNENGKTGNIKRFFNDSKIIPMNQNMFDDDSVAMIGLKSKWLKIQEKNSTRSVTVDIENFPYVLIWSNATKPIKFVCIEPWHGIDDFIDASGVLAEKKGIQALSTNEEFSTVCKMTFTE